MKNMEVYNGKERTNLSNNNNIFNFINNGYFII